MSDMTTIQFFVYLIIFFDFVIEESNENVEIVIFSRLKKSFWELAMPAENDEKNEK